MNIDALVVLQPSDVEHIAQHQERYGRTKLLFLDAGILEAALHFGLQNYELRRIQVASDMSALNFSETLVTAAAIDMALTEVRTELWGAGAFHGWDQGLLHIPLMCAYAMRSIAKAIERSWPEQRLGLLRPANPTPAMLAADIVAANPARWSVVDAYPAASHWNPVVLDVCFDFAGVRRLVEAGEAQCLTHIPTCLHDGQTFEAAVSEAFSRNIDLPSLMWDVPVRRGTSFLLQNLEAVDRDAACTLYQERARRVYTDHLTRLIPSRAALTQQVETFARRSLIQAMNFVGLRQALRGSRPHFVVCDHDTGNNGPLFSIAAEMKCDITVLPHSAYPTSLMPHAQRVTVIELDGVGVPVRTVLGLPVPTRAVQFRDLAGARARPATRRVCLLINSLRADNQSYVDFFALITFYKKLATVCGECGWELVVRLKPGSAALNVVASAFGKPVDYFVATMAQPMSEVAHEADICIAFGEPTSATITFFNAGSYLVHACDQEWPNDYRLTTPLSSLMPTQRCDDAIASLGQLMRDPVAYSEKHRWQTAQYAQRRGAVHETIFTARAPAPSNSIPQTEYAPC